MSAADSVLVVVDGVPLRGDAARISVFDRGLLFGHAVFETIRVYGTRAFELRLHMERLLASASQVGIDVRWSSTDLAREVEEGIALSMFPDAYVRVMLTAGAGALELLPKELPPPTRIVIVAPLPAIPRELYLRGLRGRLVRMGRGGDAARVVGAKLTNYLPNLRALAEARGHGDEEALLVDETGCVTQGATSNIFAVVDGCLTTPPAEGATLRGVTRRNVLELANAAGISAIERRLTDDELRRAEEVFLTSSIREVMACTSIDGVPVGDGRPGDMTKALHRAFRLRVGCPPDDAEYSLEPH